MCVKSFKGRATKALRTYGICERLDIEMSAFRKCGKCLDSDENIRSARMDVFGPKHRSELPFSATLGVEPYFRCAAVETSN